MVFDSFSFNDTVKVAEEFKDKAIRYNTTMLKARIE